ncbi:hypothetical protein Tco_0657604 [Tanacetum coccineum]
MRITHFKYHEKAKLPRNVKVYEGDVRKSHSVIRGEAAARSAEVVRAPQWDKGTTHPGWRDSFTPLIKTPKEILEMESVNFLPPLPLVKTPENQNLNKFCDYHGDRGHNTNEFHYLKKQIEEAVASGKLAHLVKDIRRGNQRNKSQGRGGVKFINMVGSEGGRKRPYEMEKPGLTEEIAFPAIPQNCLTDAPIILEGTIKGYHVQRIYIDGGSSSEIMYEHCFKNFDADIKSRLRKSNAPLVGFLGEVYDPLGLVNLRVTMEEPGRSKTVLLEFVIVKCRSPYNLIMGRTGMRSLEAVGSTIHLMIKFPTTRGVATVETSKEALIREQVILQVRSIHNQRPRKEPMMPEETWEEGTMKEKVIIHNPDHPIVINDKLSSGCKQKIEETLQKNVDVTIGEMGSRVENISCLIRQKERSRGASGEKVFRHGGQVLRVSDKNNEGASGSKEKPQEELVTKDMEIMRGKKTKKEGFRRRNDPSQPE